LLGAIVQATTPWVAVTTVERADTLRRIWGVTPRQLRLLRAGAWRTARRRTAWRRTALLRTALCRRLLLGSAAAAGGSLAAMVPEQHGGGTRADAHDHGHDHDGDEPAVAPTGRG
jgi:hypothetical protein